MKNRIALVLLILLVCGHIGGNVFYFSRNGLPEGKDCMSHALAFLQLSRTAESTEEEELVIPDRGKFYNLCFTAYDYPPFFYLTAYAFDKAGSGLLPYAPLLVSTVSLSIVLFMIYAIGRYTISPAAGLVSVLVFYLYPITIPLSRHFNLEMLLTAMVAISIWLMLKTEGFRRPGYSLALGTVMGLGMLTKQTFLVYAGGPFLMTIIYCWLQGKPDRQRLLNLLNLLVVFMLFTLVFYHEPQIYINTINRMGMSGAVEGPDLLSLRHLSYYWRFLVTVIGWLLLSAGLISLFFLNPLKKSVQILFLSWLLLPPLFFSAVKLKYAEYLVPMLPVLALITGNGLNRIKGFAPRLITVALLLAAALSLNIAGKNNFFYHRYHPLSRVKVLFPADNGGADFSEICRRIGDHGGRAGIFLDKADCVDFSNFFIRKTFAHSRRKTKLVLFDYSVTEFFRNLEQFDIIIFFSGFGREWPTEEEFQNYVETWNTSRLARIVFTGDEIRGEQWRGKSRIKIPAIMKRKLIKAVNGMEKVYTAEYTNSENGRVIKMTVFFK